MTNKGSKSPRIRVQEPAAASPPEKKRRGMPPGRSPWDNMPKCGGKTRQNEGKPCQLPAGFRTDHMGQGRCYLHGGLAAIKHGRYSSITRPRIKELLEQYEHDPEPLNLLPEVKLLRALLTDYIERYDTFVEGLDTWHASWDSDFTALVDQWRSVAWDKLRLDPDAELDPLPQPIKSAKRPRQVLDITAAGMLADKVGAMVDRIEKYAAAQRNIITLETLSRVLEQLGVELVHTLKEEVRDEALRARILASFEQRWASVQVALDQRGAARNQEGLGPN